MIQSATLLLIVAVLGVLTSSVLSGAALPTPSPIPITCEDRTYLTPSCASLTDLEVCTESVEEGAGLLCESDGFECSASSFYCPFPLPNFPCSPLRVNTSNCTDVPVNDCDLYYDESSQELCVLYVVGGEEENLICKKSSSQCLQALPTSRCEVVSSGFASQKIIESVDPNYDDVVSVHLSGNGSIVGIAAMGENLPLTSFWEDYQAFTYNTNGGVYSRHSPRPETDIVDNVWVSDDGKYVAYDGFQLCHVGSISKHVVQYDNGNTPPAHSTANCAVYLDRVNRLPEENVTECCETHSSSEYWCTFDAGNEPADVLLGANYHETLDMCTYYYEDVDFSCPSLRQVHCADEEIGQVLIRENVLTGDREVVSIDANGLVNTDNRRRLHGLSADGQYILFGDDVVLRDMTTNTIRAVPEGSSGISGHFVVGVHNDTTFIYDVETEALQFVPLSIAGFGMSGESVSGNGMYVAFSTSPLTFEGLKAETSLYIWNVSSSTVQELSLQNVSDECSLAIISTMLSYDGTFLTFRCVGTPIFGEYFGSQLHKRFYATSYIVDYDLNSNESEIVFEQGHIRLSDVWDTRYIYSPNHHSMASDGNSIGIRCAPGSDQYGPKDLFLVTRI